METTLRWSYLNPELGGTAPSKAHRTDSGFDVFTHKNEIIYAGDVVKIDTNICVQPAVEHLALEDARMYNKTGGWTLGAFLWDKSGLGSKGLKVLGGVIDNGYTGHIQVIMMYCSLEEQIAGLRKQLLGLKEGIRAVIAQDQDGITNLLDKLLNLDEPPLPYRAFKAGEKLTQLVVQRVELPILQFEEKLRERERGANGFGSSGV